LKLLPVQVNQNKEAAIEPAPKKDKNDNKKKRLPIKIKKQPSKQKDEILGSSGDDSAKS
jgi:hypothetical protein